jgi:hypothetical protein
LQQEKQQQTARRLFSTKVILKTLHTSHKKQKSLGQTAQARDMIQLATQQPAVQTISVAQQSSGMHQQ